MSITVTFPPSVPTVRYNLNFDATKEAVKIQDAMKGKGADEDAIIQILTNSTLAQRLQLATAYKSLFERDLLEQLKKELSGKLETVVEALLQKPEEYDATSLRNAIAGVGTNEDTLIEIIFSRSQEELEAIERAYKATFKKDLEADVKGDTSGAFQKLLLAHLAEERQVAYRGYGWPSRGFQVDLSKAKADAKTLIDAGTKKWITDESIYVDIFAKRSLAHLKQVFDEYKRATNKDIEKAIKDDLSGDIEKTLVAIVEFVNNKNTFFAKRLRDSMQGLGTNDKKLVRIIVTRSEKDLESIKEEYLRLFGKTLEHSVKNETSGDFEKVLVALLQRR